MSEAFGGVLFKVSGDLAKTMEHHENVLNETMSKLFQEAGLNIADVPEAKNTKEFMLEEADYDNDYLALEIFGEEWMNCCQFLVKNGSDIEVYSSIFHEHNYTEYYILSADGERFFDCFDGESGDGNNQVNAAWLAKIPPALIAKYKDFLVDEDDD
ncbi:MAG: hypothetical protein HKM24_00295 [Gammaproteobacteria bacterium]|nr:hypothetical protein [Gammaproteobacteria bacterium]